MSLPGPLGATQSGAFELRPEALDLPGARSRSRTGSFALVALMALSALLIVCAAKTDLFLPESVRPMPGWLGGVFANTGVSLGTVGLVFVIGALFVAYAVTATRAEQLSARTVLACIAGLHALVLLAPPLVSTDVFSYQAYARMFSLYGANPYLHGPHAIALDPVYPFIGAKWVNMPSAYGPAFTALSVLLAPLSLASSVLAYKGIAAVSSLAIVGLVWNLARLRGLDPVKAAALVGLNPLMVIYGVGGGHNDLLMLLAMMVGVSLVLQHRDRAAASSMMLAGAVKLTGGLIAPFALAELSGPLERLRRREFLLGAAVTVASIAALAFALFGLGSLRLLATLRQVQAMGDWHSIPGFISTRLGLGTIGHVAGLFLGAVFVCVLFVLLRRVWRRELDWIDGAAWATAAMIATASSLLPWYVAWLLPLAALGHDRRLLRTAIAMTGVVMTIEIIGYIPHAHVVLGL